MNCNDMYYVMLLIVAGIFWALSGLGGLVFWWTRSRTFRNDINSIPGPLFGLVIFMGPFAWLVGWLVHGNDTNSGSDMPHDSFWKTIVESPQWKAWEVQVAKNFSAARRMKTWPSPEYQRKRLPIFDVDECRECGFISAAHFQAFLKFCKKWRRS